MRNFLFILFLINSTYAKEIKYECGKVGRFLNSIPKKDLQLDIYVDEKYVFFIKWKDNKKLPFPYKQTIKNEYGVIDIYAHLEYDFFFQRYKENNYHRLYFYNDGKLSATYVCYDEGERSKNENR